MTDSVVIKETNDRECEFISPTSLDKPYLARIPEIKLGKRNLKK